MQTQFLKSIGNRKLRRIGSEALAQSRCFPDKNTILGVFMYRVYILQIHRPNGHIRLPDANDKLRHFSGLHFCI